MPDIRQPPHGAGQHSHKIAWAVVAVIVVLFLILIAVAASIRANHDPNAELAPAGDTQQIAPAANDGAAGEAIAPPPGDTVAPASGSDAAETPAPDDTPAPAPEHAGSDDAAGTDGSGM